MKKNLLITCVMLLFAITSMAQNKITISGVVTDKTGETVIGASVLTNRICYSSCLTELEIKRRIYIVVA